MNWKLVFNILGAIGLFLVQAALIKSLPGGDYLQLSLVALIFMVVLYNLETAALWFLINGFLLDLYAFNWFGVYTLLLIVILGAVYLLLNNVLTNRSLYAFLLMTAVAILFYDLSCQLVFNLSWDNFGRRELWRLGVNLSATVIIFYGLTGWGHRLRPVFLIRSKN